MVHIVVRLQNPGYPDRMQSDAALCSLSAGREKSQWAEEADCVRVSRK